MLDRFGPNISPEIDNGSPKNCYGVPLSRRRLIKSLGGIGILACSCGMHSLSSEAQTRARGYCANSSPRGTAASKVPLEDYDDSAIFVYLERERELLQQFFSAESRLYINLNSNDAYMSGNHTVLGERYINRYENEKYGLLKLTGVLAHEKSHVFQIKWNMDNMLTDVKGYKVKYVEIHADYMAGAYISWREYLKDSAPDKLSDFFFDLGDRVKGSDRAHGTQDERRRAFAAGYNQRLAKDDVETTAARGLIYVRNAI